MNNWCATIVFISLLATTGFGQHSSEKEQFSFKTTNSKTLCLSLDTLSNTMICRYGTVDAPELEVLDDLNDTDTVFTYVYYFRGGGAQNAGLDLNHVCFQRENYTYSVYYRYSAETEESSCGIYVENRETGKITDIEGLTHTMKGSLVDFRFNHLIPVIWDANL